MWKGCPGLWKAFPLRALVRPARNLSLADTPPLTPASGQLADLPLLRVVLGEPRHRPCPFSLTRCIKWEGLFSLSLPYNNIVDCRPYSWEWY